MKKTNAAKKIDYAQWKGGDRIGKLSTPRLRELRLGALRGAPVDADEHIEVIETLEEIIAVVEQLSEEPFLVANEIPDSIKKIVDRARERDEQADEKVREMDEKLSDVLKGADDNLDDVRGDHAAELVNVRALAKESYDGAVERAEIAESEVAAQRTLIGALHAKIAELSAPKVRRKKSSTEKLNVSDTLGLSVATSVPLKGGPR